MIDFLRNALIYVVPFLAILTLVVTVHELGHFLAAKTFGVAMDRFAIGFGKPLWSRIDKSGVEWRVGWIPLGGYVRFSGDSNDASVPDAEDLADLKKQIEGQLGAEAVSRFYHFKPVWQRAIIAAAGPLANFALGIVILTVLLLVVGPTKMLLPRVGEVAPGSPAARAGFQTGDLIQTADGRRIVDHLELRMFVRFRTGHQTDFKVLRGEEQIVLTATPARTITEPEMGGKPLGYLGIGPSKRPEDIVEVRYNLLTATAHATHLVIRNIDTTINYISRVVTGREAANQFSSVIGIAHASGSATKQGAASSPDPKIATGNVFLNLFSLAAMMSVAVGFANLLPIPVLDGGHLVFYAYEALARRPVAASVQAAGMKVGLALLLGFMLFATWNDLQRLQAFKFLGGLFS